MSEFAGSTGEPVAIQSRERYLQSVAGPSQLDDTFSHRASDALTSFLGKERQ